MSSSHHECTGLCRQQPGFSPNGALAFKQGRKWCRFCHAAYRNDQLLCKCCKLLMRVLPRGNKGRRRRSPARN